MKNTTDATTPRRFRGTRARVASAVTLAAAILATVVFGPPLLAGASGGSTGWYTVGTDLSTSFETHWDSVNHAVGYGDYYDTQFRRDSDGFVHLRGPALASSATLTGGGGSGPLQSEIFNLPCGFRPAHTAAQAISINDVYGHEFYSADLAIKADGDVYVVFAPGPMVASQDSFSAAVVLDGVTFEADGDPSGCGGDQGTTTTTAP